MSRHLDVSSGRTAPLEAWTMRFYASKADLIRGQSPPESPECRVVSGKGITSACRRTFGVNLRMQIHNFLISVESG